MSQNTIEVSSSNFRIEVLESPLPVLVDFWAPWCGPCRMIAPILDEIAAERAGKVKIVKVNTDDEAKLAGDYRISSIPALLFFKGGEVVGQTVGVQSKAALLSQLDSL